MSPADTIAALAASATRAARHSEVRDRRAGDDFRRRDAMHKAAAVLPERDPQRVRAMALAEHANLTGMVWARLAEGEPDAARNVLRVLRICRTMLPKVAACATRS